MNRRLIFKFLPAAIGAATLVNAAAPPAKAFIPRQASAPRPSHIATHDGLALAYVDWGEGPTVLLVHSWAMNSGIWRHQVAGLTAAGYRVVTYDRRGHGRSTPTGRGYDIDMLADDLAAVIEQLDLKDVTLVAHSMGAVEAVHYLARHGEARIRSVVLVAPTTPFVKQTADNPEGLPAELLAANRAAIAGDFPRWAAESADRYFRSGTSAETKSWGVRMLIDTPTPVALACLDVVSSFDARPDLRKISIRALVIQGDADVSAPLQLTGRRTAAMIKGSRLVVIPGGPHGLYETDADRVNDEIVNFIRA